MHPETPVEGRSLADLFAGKNLDAEAIHLNMKTLMDAEGLPYERRTHTYNSRLAQEVAKWSETQAGGDAFHAALYKAYFVDGLNLSDPDVLLDLAHGVGLDCGVVQVVIDERTFSNAVDADWMLSREYGVTGVPTFVADGRGVVGAQEYSVLERLVLAAGAAFRPQQL